MATRSINIEVLNLDQLRQLNTELAKTPSLLNDVSEAAAQMQGVFAAFNRSAGAAGRQAAEAGNQVRELRASLIDLKTTAGEGAGNIIKVGDAAEKAGKSFDISFASMLQWRAVSAIFSGIEESVRSATKALSDYDFAAARTTRLTGPQDRSYTMAALREGTAMTGRSASDAGEAWYQISTYLKSATDRADAFRATMGLVTGTEADTRDATRALIQVFEQFGDQLPKNLTDGQKMSRIAEMMAVDFKDANLEVGEWAQSMKYLGPIAEATNIRLEQTAAIISTLSAIGQRGRMAGTGPAQLLMNLITNYDTALGGREYKGQVYHYEMPIDQQGYVDAIRMIDSIVARIKQLKAEGPEGTKQAEDFARAVSGSVQGMRALMGLATDNGLSRLYQELQRNSEALAGQTHELEKLKAAMQETFSVTSSRLWQAFLGDVSDSLDSIAQKLGIIQKLKAATESHEAKDWAKTENLKEGIQLTTEDPVTHVKHMQELVRQAIDEVRSVQIEAGVKPKYGPHDEDLTSWYMKPGFTAEQLMHREGISETGAYAVKALLSEHGLLFKTAINGPQDRFGLNQLYELQNKILPEEMKRVQDAEARKVNPSATGVIIGQHLQDAFGTAPVQAACAWFASKVLEASGLALTKNGSTINSASALKDNLIGQFHAQLIETLKPGQQPQNAHPGDIAFFYGPHYGTRKDQRGAGWHVGLMEDQNTIVQGGDYGARIEEPFGISRGGTAFIYRLPSGAIEQSFLHGPAVTDAPDKSGKSVTEAIEGRIALDKALLTGLESLDFPTFQKRAAAIGADWEHQQAQLARKGGLDPNAEKAELLLIHSGHSDYQDYLSKRREEWQRDLEQKKKSREQEDKDSASDHKERLEARKDMAQARYEIAKHYYGAYDPRTLHAAREADNLAGQLASPDDALRLKRGVTGNYAEAMGDYQSWYKDSYKQGLSEWLDDQHNLLTDRSANIQAGLHPSLFSEDHNAARISALTAVQQETNTRLAAVQKQKEILEAQSNTADDLKEYDSTIRELQRQSFDLGTQITNLKDMLATEQFQRAMKISTEGFDDLRAQVEHHHSLGFHQTPKEQFQDKITEALQLVAISQQQLASVMKDTASLPKDQRDDQIREAQRRLEQDQRNVEQIRADYQHGLMQQQIEQAQQRNERIEGVVEGGLTKWLTASRYDHSARPDRILGEMGKQIFDQNLQEGLKRWLGPAFGTPQDKNIAALDRNTAAIERETDRRRGSGGGANGGASDPSALGLTPTNWRDATLGMADIHNATGPFGTVTTALTAVVGLADAFSRAPSSDQAGINRRLNPALSHGPQDFTGTAYLYRATGGNLNSQQQAEMNQLWGLNASSAGGGGANWLGAGFAALSLIGALSGRGALHGTPGIAPGGLGGAGSFQAKLDAANVTSTDLTNFYQKGGNVFASMDAGGDIGFPGSTQNADGSFTLPGASGGGGGGVGAAQVAQAGLGAVGIWDQGAQGGALTGALGGALSGFEIGNSIVPGVGGLWGAVGGGVLGLLGGLFGHHSQPQPQINQQLNPSLFNAPADLDYYAYLYRATGGKLTAQQQANYNAALPSFPTNAPIVPSSTSRAATFNLTVPIQVDGVTVMQKTVTQQVLAEEQDSAFQGGVNDYRVPV